MTKWQGGWSERAARRRQRYAERWCAALKMVKARQVKEAVAKEVPKTAVISVPQSGDGLAGLRSAAAARRKGTVSA
jgi:hypothetical protein